MAEWIVSVPIVGRMEIYVTADDEDSARAKAIEGKWDGHDIIETDIVERCKGNVCHLQSGIDVIPND